VAQSSASHKNLRNEKPSHSMKHVTDSLLQDEFSDATTHEKIADDVTICLPSNDAPRQWNLGKWYQSHVRLKIILYRTVLSGRASFGDSIGFRWESQ